MKQLLIFWILLFSFQVNGQEIFDQERNRLYYTEDSGKKHEVTLSDGRRATYHEKMLIDNLGKTYTYDYTWEQVIIDGKVIMTYNFNRRRWEWVEGAGLTAGKYGKKEDIQRIYEKVENTYITSDQGENAILTFLDGKYIDEFGRTVYTREGGGGYSNWMNIIILHNYYQKNYLDSKFKTEIDSRRAFVADSLANSNSLAIAMLEQGKKYEQQTTFMGDPFEMVYFTVMGGDVQILNQDQIQLITNDWLIRNPNTRRRTAPFDIPEAGFFVSKKEAKKNGIQGINSTKIIFEIKIKPESLAEFQTTLGL